MDLPIYHISHISVNQLSTLVLWPETNKACPTMELSCWTAHHEPLPCHVPGLRLRCHFMAGWEPYGFLSNKNKGRLLISCTRRSLPKWSYLHMFPGISIGKAMIEKWGETPMILVPATWSARFPSPRETKKLPPSDERYSSGIRAFHRKLKFYIGWNGVANFRTNHQTGAAKSG